MSLHFPRKRLAFTLGLRRRKAKRREPADGANADVIVVVSSDEDEDECMWVPVFPSRTALPLTRLRTRSPIRRPTRARRVIESSDSEGEHVEHANTSAQILQSRPSITKRPPAQNTGSVIDLTISSDEGENEGVAPTNARKVPKEPVHKVSSRATTSQLKDSPRRDENKFTIPLFADDPDDDEEDDDPMNKDDGSILVLYVASSTHLPQV